MEDTYSYNYASDDMSWYNTDQAYYLSRDGEYVGSITIYADTATDDLHESVPTAVMRRPSTRSWTCWKPHFRNSAIWIRI